MMRSNLLWIHWILSHRPNSIYTIAKHWIYSSFCMNALSPSVSINSNAETDSAGYVLQWLRSERQMSSLLSAKMSCSVSRLKRKHKIFYINTPEFSALCLLAQLLLSFHFFELCVVISCDSRHAHSPVPAAHTKIAHIVVIIWSWFPPTVQNDNPIAEITTNQTRTKRRCSLTFVSSKYTHVHSMDAILSASHLIAKIFPLRWWRKVSKWQKK